jgi:hypothetical protein
MKKTSPKKKAVRSLKFKRRAIGDHPGRSPVTGARVLRSVAKGASISLDEVRRVVQDLEPLALD